MQRYEYTHIQTYIHNITCIKEAQIQFFVVVFVVCSSALNEGNGNLKKIAEFTRTTAGHGSHFICTMNFPHLEPPIRKLAAKNPQEMQKGLSRRVQHHTCIQSIMLRF